MEQHIRRRGKTLASVFLESAKKNWRRKAIADSTGKNLTYGKTLIGSVLLGDLLKASTGAFRNVGVLLPPSVGGALSNLALSILGKVSVNLNYTASQEAIAHALKKPGIQKVITSRKFMAGLKEAGLAQHFLSALGNSGLKEEDALIYLEDLLPRVNILKKLWTAALLRLLPLALAEKLFLGLASRSLDETATILFTSGSSAEPKGVKLSHLNILSDIEMVREVVTLRPDDTVLGIIPHFHSFGYTVTLWLPLLSGISAVYHNKPQETKIIATLAAQHKPTILLGTPGFLSLYARTIAKEAFSSLRLVIAGAEKLHEEVAKAFQEKFGLTPFEGYGATELSPVAAVNTADAGPQRGNKTGSLGQSLPGGVLRVVDPETLVPLAAGKEGLILVKGPHVMKGYLGEPQKTAETVIDGWYLTGDYGFADEEGFVTLTTRLVIKIAGEMIPAGALESQLHQAAGPGEKNFAVTSIPDDNKARGDKLVVLYTGYEGPIEELIAKLRIAGLPNLWIPTKESFHKVDEIPVLGTGKRDLRAIKALAMKLEGSH
jgi:acyl-[acyl-carrier-protein]-phospholipid O-acyltransferase/long-chain-fatty-acid--[acyl-carrier-protein] ligase